MALTISSNSGALHLSPGNNPVTVLAGVTIIAPQYGIYGSAGTVWTITNAGTVSGAATGPGVALGGPGSVTNSGTAALIAGGSNGLSMKGSGGYLYNQGTVSAVTTSAVAFYTGGTVVNSGTAARIAGGEYGVFSKGTVAATVTNQGTISATTRYGIQLQAGGVVTNSGMAASIIGRNKGVSLLGTIASTVSNQGTISGKFFYGVFLGDGGTLTNGGTAATIMGGEYAIGAGGTNPATIINQGTIAGGATAVVFADVNNNVFELYPGAVTDGIVNFGTGAGNTLALGAAAATGTISHIAAEFPGFSVLEVENGATWVAPGSLGITGALDIEGTGSLEATGYLLSPHLLITGTGTLGAGSGGSVGVGLANLGFGNRIATGPGATLTTSGALSAKDFYNAGAIITTGTSGVQLRGGTLSNRAAGTISGNANGVTTYGATTLNNLGAISGGYSGVYLNGGGTVSNGAAATISGTGVGIFFASPIPGTVLNHGIINGNGGIGVLLQFGGVIRNASPSAQIVGGGGVASGNYGPATVINLGTISGSANNIGVDFNDGGTVVNAGTGALISGGSYGILSYGYQPDLVTNQGTILAQNAGVLLSQGDGSRVINSGTAAKISGGQIGVEISFPNGNGATITNQGTIVGGTFGVLGGTNVAPVTVINRGTISGGNAAVRFNNVDGNLLQEFPGAVENGAVQGGTGIDTLEFGGGLAVGTVSGVGAKYTGFEVLEVDTGANWRMTGANTLGAGATLALGGAAILRVTDTLVSAGNLTLSGAGTLVAAATGRIEIGKGGAALPGQIVVDAGRRLVTGGVLSARAIVNRGSISGAGYGVHLVTIGTVTNSGTAAAISGAQYGVYAPDGITTVVNQGRIAGTGGAGVYLGPGGAVTNGGTGAVISGGQWGVESTGLATVVNQGTVTGTTAGGVLLWGGGAVANTGTAARIVGGAYGIAATYGAAIVTNQGSIAGTSAGGIGVVLRDGGTLTNSGATARISGGKYGVLAIGANAATIINQGTLSGATAAVHFGNASGNLFRTFPGAVTSGVVQGGVSVDTLALGSGASAGTVSGIGSHYIRFEVLEVDAGASWLVTGANTFGNTATIGLAGSLQVTGTLIAPGNLTVTGSGRLAATGGGQVDVGTAPGALANQIVVGANRTLATSAVLSATSLSVGSGGLLIGTGNVNAVVANAGTIEAAGGTLTVAGAVTGAGALKVAVGATLVLNGASNVAATVLDNGTLTIGASDSLDVTASVMPASAGLFVLTGASLLEVAADAAASNKITFLGAPGDRLVVDFVGQFGANVGLGTYAGPKLENFGTLDAIDMKNLVFSGATIDGYTAASGRLQLHSGAVKATLSFENATLGSGSFHLAADAGTGTVLTRN